jgi:nucleoid DNA-binding protein
MQELLTDYLFQNKKCPLPGVGNLAIHRQEAQIFVTEKRITAPQEEIFFSADETNADDLHDFIAAQKRITNEEAAYQLKRYCEEIKNISDSRNLIVENAGEFYKDADGNLSFTGVVLPPSFSPDVFAERVIHPHETHAILVGDTHTTNAVMNEYYAEETVSNRSRWWIAAIIFGVIAAGLIGYYFNDKSGTNTFGNASKHTAAPASKTYHIIP